MSYSVVFIPEFQENLFNKTLFSSKTSLVTYKKHLFSDGECFFTLSNYENITGEKVLLIYQLTHIESGCSTNDQLFKLLLLCRIIKKLFPIQIDLLLPYFPYTRQEKKFNNNIPPTIFLAGELLDDAGIKNIISCDLHSDSIQELLPTNLIPISMSNFWKDEIKKNIPQQNVCIVSPDQGGYERTLKIANLLKLEHVFLEKRRTEEQKTVFVDIKNDVVANKNIIVVDDIIDTANTAIGVCDILKRKGAKDIFGCFTHAVLSGNSIAKLENSQYKKIYITNSVIHCEEKLPKIFCVFEIYEFLISKLRFGNELHENLSKVYENIIDNI